MKAEELFAIDVAAEVETLCLGQLQGPWQVPAEIVRLASARGASRVDIDREGGGIRVHCDGRLASTDELRDLAMVFDDGADVRGRQRALSRVETAGLSALLWVVGLPGARARVAVRSADCTAVLRARRRRVTLDVDDGSSGSPSTSIVWGCASFRPRLAVAWLRTALRFVPIPVAVCGKPVERGFRGGLYRMRINEPVPCELTVTDAGDAPTLWLLEHGVLSARAVIPGYPAFSAAVEMGGLVPPGASADELRASSNRFLEALVDRAARMLVLLVDRLATVDEPVRARLATLMLRFAVRGLRRAEILSSPIVAVRDGGGLRMMTPEELTRRASARGGVLTAVEPGSETDDRWDEPVVVATAEERGLLSELLGVRVERLANAGGNRLVGSVGEAARVLWRSVRRLTGRRSLPDDRLTAEERRLVAEASTVGIEIALAEGHGGPVKSGGTTVVGRRRPEVATAARVVAGNDAWLWPALLAIVDEDLEIPDRVRSAWVTELSSSGVLS